MKRILYLCITALVLLCTFFLFRGTIEENTTRFLYSNRYMIDVEGWKRKNIVDFEFDIKNKNLTHSFIMILEYSNDYRYSNIHIDYKIEKDDITIEKGQKNYMIFSQDWGEPMGKKKIFSNNLVIDLPLASIGKLESAGKYKVSVQQKMRDDCLKGIRSIEIVCDSKKQYLI